MKGATYLLTAALTLGGCAAPIPEQTQEPRQEKQAPDPMEVISQYVSRVKLPSAVVELEANPVTQLLEALPADVYLLDFSGSMRDKMQTGISKIEAVKNYEFPEGSQAYAFSGGGIPEGTYIGNIGAGGGTPLWDVSCWTVERNSHTGLTIMTDGKDARSQFFGPQDVIDYALKNNTRISIGALGVPCEGDLEKVASATGGECVER